MTFFQCVQKLSIAEYPEYFPELYDRMTADGSIYSTEILEESYIRGVDKAYGLFDHSLDAVLRCARLIKENRALLCYTNLLSAAVCDRALFKAHLRPLLPAVSKDKPAHDFVGLIAMLPIVKTVYAIMRERHFNDEIIRDNFSDFELSVDVHTMRYGWPAFDQTYFVWMQLYLDVEVINYGGFNFQMVNDFDYPLAVLKNKRTEECVRLVHDTRMHRSGMVFGSAGCTDEGGAYIASFTEGDTYFEGYPCDDNGYCTGVKKRYPRAEWDIALRPGDPVLNVHIPYNANIKGDAFARAIRGALEIYSRTFPEFKPRAVYCRSWLMNPHIDELCGGAPAILNFQSHFKLHPVISYAKAVFNFVFYKPFDSYEELPENTRLMRALKKLYLSGGYLHEFGAVRLI